jgi:medium-chain acyl-[acyl-carrier-protein] hydrolase
MGALVSFELARYLRRMQAPVPAQLFLSGRSAPQIPDADPPTYNLPEAEFIKAVRSP